METLILSEMKRSNIIEMRRQQVKPETRKTIELSFQIVDRIHEILESKGMKQKDLALALGKSEAEISKWMRGTHNFTIETIASIENALGKPILKVYKTKKLETSSNYTPIDETSMVAESLPNMGINKMKLVH